MGSDELPRAFEEVALHGSSTPVLDLSILRARPFHALTRTLARTLTRTLYAQHPQEAKRPSPRL
eukprot:15434795-Alexandrium_andersonii.AAC.1